MTAEELRDVIMSAEYKQDLEELSSYLASIKQERPIVYCLAKHLRKRGHEFQLEATLRDLVVDGKHVEFKLYYDCDMEKLENELRKYGDRPFSELREAAHANKLSLGWCVGLKVFEDICVKKPDIFVWIICSRDLSNVCAGDRTRICWSTAQNKWNAKHPYSDRAYLAVTDSFLEKLQAYRPFSILKEEIVTNGDFPSTYHFRICDFTL